jgi:hypothetical protein
LQISKPSEIISSGVISISHSELLIYEKFPKKRGCSYKLKGANAVNMTAKFWEEEYGKLGLDKIFELMKQYDVVLDATLSVYEPDKI